LVNITNQETEMHHNDEVRRLIDQKILLTGPMRPRTMADSARIRAALRAARVR
jgi:hypothetical protein